MATLGQRVAQIEVRADTFQADVAELKGMTAALEGQMERLFLWVAGSHSSGRRVRPCQHDR